MSRIAEAAEWPTFRAEIKARIWKLHEQLEDPQLGARDVDIVRGRILELRDLLRRVEPAFVPPIHTPDVPISGY